jgi:hypothetical protein
LLLQVQLAEVAGLRSALRDMAGASDGAAAQARLHQELGHWRGKESALRASLNRSEVERIMLERQVGLWGGRAGWAWLLDRAGPDWA